MTLEKSEFPKGPAPTLPCHTHSAVTVHSSVKALYFSFYRGKLLCFLSIPLLHLCTSDNSTAAALQQHSKMTAQAAVSEMYMQQRASLPTLNHSDQHCTQTYTGRTLGITSTNVIKYYKCYKKNIVTLSAKVQLHRERK